VIALSRPIKPAPFNLFAIGTHLAARLISERSLRANIKSLSVVDAINATLGARDVVYDGVYNVRRDFNVAQPGNDRAPDVA